MKKYFLLLSVVITSILMSACNPFEEETEEQRQNRLNEEEIAAYLEANNLTAQKTESGVYYIINKVNPVGQLPLVGDLAEMHFVGRLLSGTIIDSTSPFFNEPKRFVFDDLFTTNEVVPGIEATFVQFREGEEVTLIIPSRLAYGSGSTSLIPPYSVLRYDVSSYQVKTEQEQINEFIAKDTLNYIGIDSVVTAYIKQIPDSDGAAVAGPDSLVTVNYVGRYLDGREFDRNTVFVFTVASKANRATSQVIEGWDRALTGMKVGEKKRILLYSNLAYGAAGNQPETGGIPPYSVLWFDIELLVVR